MLNAKLESGVVGFKACTNRLATLDLDAAGHKLKLICVHFPHAWQKDDAQLDAERDRTDLYTKLSMEARRARRQGRRLIVGVDHDRG